jgi:hypothetical protein
MANNGRKKIILFFSVYVKQLKVNISTKLYAYQLKGTRIQPSHSQEENEPIYVFAHPQASLIKRPLTNATMVWLLDGKSDKETASFIEQGDLMWIPSLRKSLNERNVTYRAIQDDGRITEVNTTITVKCRNNVVTQEKYFL